MFFFSFSEEKNSLSLLSHLVPGRPGSAVEQHRDRRRPLLSFHRRLLLWGREPNVGDLPRPRPVPHSLDQPPLPFRAPPLGEGAHGKGDEGDLARKLLGEDSGLPRSGGDATWEVGAVADFGLLKEFFFFFSFRGRGFARELRVGDQRGEQKLSPSFCSSSLSPSRP